MSNLLKVKIRKHKRLTSLMGLTLDGSRLDGVVLRRVNGSLHLQQSFSFALTLDPLTAAPELVGREIRNQLDTAGVRERHCVVAIPLKWVLTASTEMPQLSEADAAGLLQLEAERSFHSDTDTLQIAHSNCALENARQYVTLAGAARVQLTALERVLTAAKLKPVSFSTGITALQPPEGKAGTLALLIGETYLGLQVTAADGVASLRALDGAIENEDNRHRLQTELVAREVRITLGQLPDEVRGAIKRIRIFGPRELAQSLADDLDLRFEAAGLQSEVVTAYVPNEDQQSTTASIVHASCEYRRCTYAHSTPLWHTQLVDYARYRSRDAYKGLRCQERFSGVAHLRCLPCQPLFPDQLP